MLQKLTYIKKIRKTCNQGCGAPSHICQAYKVRQAEWPIGGIFNYASFCASKTCLPQESGGGHVYTTRTHKQLNVTRLGLSLYAYFLKL